MNGWKRPALALVLGAGLAGGLAACSGSGNPTAIELDIDRIEFVQTCIFIVAGDQCGVGVAAYTAEGQRITNPVLRWSSTNTSVVRIVSDDRSTAVIEGIAPGSSNIEVTNTTNTANARIEVRVARPSK